MCPWLYSCNSLVFRDHSQTNMLLWILIVNIFAIVHYNRFSFHLIRSQIAYIYKINKNTMTTESANFRIDWSCTMPQCRVYNATLPSNVFVVKQANHKEESDSLFVNVHKIEQPHSDMRLTQINLTFFRFITNISSSE